MPSIERFDLTIADVTRLTGLRYHVIYRAIHSGELAGIVRGRLLRTNAHAVAQWEATLSNQLAKSMPVSKPQKPQTPKHRGKVSGYKFVDPDQSGS